MTREEFETKTEEWHEGEGDSLEYQDLHDYIGITLEQYCEYVRGGFDE